MIRVIKRYESRKLYDTEESRYVSLEDIALWVREGQEVRVVDNATSADVSAQVLTQIILDEGKKGTSFLPTELLHELVRAGEKAFTDGVEQFQGKMNRIVQSSIDRLAPVRRAREEMGQLRDRLSQLERALDDLDANDAVAEPVAPKATAKTATRSKTATSAKKATSAKAASTKAASTKAASTKAASTKADSTKAASKTAKKPAPASADGAAPKTRTRRATTTKTTATKTPAAKKAPRATSSKSATVDS